VGESNQSISLRHLLFLSLGSGSNFHNSPKIVAENPIIVMSRILLAIWGNKIYWDRQLKLIRQLESTMGRAEKIL
jgi:hypothetical protein